MLKKISINVLLILLGISITSVASASWWDSIKPNNLTVPSPRDFPTSIPGSVISTAKDKLSSLKEKLGSKAKKSIKKAHSKITTKTKNKTKKGLTNTIQKVHHGITKSKLAKKTKNLQKKITSIPNLSF